MTGAASNPYTASSSPLLPAAAGPGPRCPARRCRPAATVSGPTRLCHRCRDHLYRDLGELSELYGKCEELLVNAPSRPLWERISGGGVQAMPLNAAAAAARSEILGTLASWAGLVVSERRISGRPRRSAADLSAFLARHLDWLAGHPAAGDLAQEVGAAASAARRVTGPAPSTEMDLGSCTHPGCDQVIQASVHHSGGRAVHQVRCGAGHKWESHQWLLLALQLRQSQDTARPVGTGDSR